MSGFADPAGCEPQDWRMHASDPAVERLNAELERLRGDLARTQTELREWQDNFGGYIASYECELPEDERHASTLCLCERSHQCLWCLYDDLRDRLVAAEQALTEAQRKTEEANYRIGQLEMSGRDASRQLEGQRATSGRWRERAERAEQANATAAQDALNAAADAIEEDMPGTDATGYYASNDHAGYLEATRHASELLRARAAALGVRDQPAEPTDDQLRALLVDAIEDEQCIDDWDAESLATRLMSTAIVWRLRKLARLQPLLSGVRDPAEPPECCPAISRWDEQCQLPAGHELPHVVTGCQS